MLFGDSLFNKNITEEDKLYDIYKKKYKMYSFCENESKCLNHYKANITRWHHTIEKGLSYEQYKPGFGRENVIKLICQLEQYAKQYDITDFIYSTALSTLHEYIDRNREYSYFDEEIEQRVNNLPGKPNGLGGTITFETSDYSKVFFDEFVKGRHSVRHFSKKSVDLDVVIEAVELAQFTPSACNRQGWKSVIIQDKSIIEKVLLNQNGNRGFGHEFDKLILVLGDLRFFNKSREVFQVFIDGGMYSMRLLDCLHFKGIATCPLSASLTPIQEQNIREILNIDEAEVLVMFIGIGNYPSNKCRTTKSERHKPNMVIV